MADKETIEALVERLISFITSHIYLSLAFLVLVHVAGYKLLKAQPRSLWKSKPLKISELYIYPIKSLRGTKVSEAVATKNGFKYDRTFMLLQVTSKGYENMYVSKYPEMTRFVTSMTMPDVSNKDRGSITVDFLLVGGKKSKTQSIPLQPDTTDLEAFEIVMHNSPTKAFKMPAEYNAWFSQCFGYEVMLAYLGDGLRDVLFEDLKPKKAHSWLTQIPKSVPFLGSPNSEGHQITFADCAPYLITSKTSLDDVSSRLQGDEEMDITKTRPNIVIEGAEKAWEEDYWAKININNAELILAHNCVRCKSLNIDYATGQPGTGESGQVLKKLQKDRRVDTGAKWSPVFGRYSFWSSKHNSRVMHVGDDVLITKLNTERTAWTWKGLG